MAAKSSSREKAGSKTALPANAPARQTARIALAVMLAVFSLWIAWDFLAPLIWAVVIALTTWPVYRAFASYLSPAGSARVVAPLVFTLVLGVVLFIPVALALHQFAQESQALLQSLTHFRQNGIPVPDLLSKLPWGEHLAQWWTANLSDPKGAVEWLGGKTNRETDIAWTRSLGAQLAHRLFLFVAIVGVFVLLRDGAWIGNRVLESADRLLGDPGERLASKMADTVRGIVNGTVVVAIGEGILIGVAYVLAGVPNPLLFSLLTMVFAMVPLGAWVVFSGAALLLLLQGGSVYLAAGVFGFGAVVMLVGDVLVWPALVGNHARLPLLLALIGIFGGVQAFGLVGLFLGPMILAALWTVWREWVVPPAARSQPC